MTSQEPASQANSLPDTQNADSVSLTQSQEVSSQQPTLTLWGRLCAIRSCFPNLGMYLCLRKRNLYNNIRKRM